MRDAKELAILQSYPLWLKVKMSQERIRDWVYHYGENGVVVSFSGGKDSTVLLHLVRQEFPDIKAVFSNTGLEYPEIQRFVKSFDNVDMVTPKMRFDEVISTYGYPLISKEVAEAIYYARRIRPQDAVHGTSNSIGNLETDRRRADMHGQRGEWKLFKRRCLQPDESNSDDKNKFWNKPKQTEWSDWRRGCL